MRWFSSRGWAPRVHQLALLEKARAGRSALLIAPTGAGKTLAGFLPTLVELSGGAQPSRRAGLPSAAKSLPLHPRSGGGGAGGGGAADAGGAAVMGAGEEKAALKFEAPPPPPP